jgi:periplasmic divalent cation tolerance protein
VPNNPIIILTTVPSKESGELLADILIRGEFAACINILPEGVSIYKWEGKLHKEKEHYILIKTLKHKELDVYKIIKENHPYKVPEIVTIGLDNGEETYLDWIKSTVH